MVFRRLRKDDGGCNGGPGGRGDMADTAVRNERAQSPSGAYKRDSRAQLAFVVATAVIDRASVVSLREAEAQGQVEQGLN